MANQGRKDRMRAETRNHVLASLLTGSAAGLTAFFALGFQAIFPPHQISWILKHTDTVRYYDTAMMFVGWEYFRHSPWQIPPGLNPNYGLELGSSIVYSDSIPLLAFPCKLLSPWLGADFQYFGIWILLCLVLQGAFAASLAARFVSWLPARLLLALFFVFSPVLLQQGWEQYSLMAQWLVLWAIDLFLTPRRQRVRWMWLLPAALAVMSSFYFAPMVLLIWAADAVKSLFQRTLQPRWLAVEFAALSATVLFTMWLCGFFVLPTASAQSTGFGTYGINLLGPIDPWGTSLFLQRQPHSPVWHAEGFAYLGMGMIFMCVIAIYESIRRPEPLRTILPLTPLAAAMAIMAVFALSNQVAFGGRIILNLGDFWGPLGPIFRGSGRLFWPAYDGIWLGASYLVLRGLRAPAATAVLAFLLAVQLIDSSPASAMLLHHNTADGTWRSPLEDTFWTSAASRYRRVVVVPSMADMPVYPIAQWGAENQIATNIVRVNRQPAPEAIDRGSQSRSADLRADHPDRLTLYVIPDVRLFAELASDLTKEHWTGRVDGYNVIAPYWRSPGDTGAAGRVP